MKPMPPAGPAMRVLDKQPKVSRRGFLRGGGLAAISVTVVIPTASIAAARDMATQQSFHTLGRDTSKTLVRMARDIYPHDKLADKFYVEAVAPYDVAASEDLAVKTLLTDGVQNLDQRAKQRYGLPYVGVRTENERVALLKDIEGTPFFKKIQGDLVTSLYNNKKLWPLFGYEGSSWEKGGYLHRGFDDIDWL
ncbi:gluconate 2-dehydrogenase subunit 3 family protein [Cupriavidus sp. WKF15]|uniref:gluconate 2-dehydrogenase subunit 3 family protein n=1 Tax=Cupriavidus sp. WKF15 TaxID=3032282 RepID=UPI0023E0B05C|nr:gluconate 2-dehydrogenase subunit 3 family protein [Cupriavidus sp. WKF15]WER50950.1 gluconate 2-dehydrogenase subunit 3 family protein [Cupriavidus sp. WKF15]